MKLTGRRCQCTVCGLVFNTESGFTRYRYGAYSEGRVCKSATTLLADGWNVSERGIWMQKGNFHAASIHSGTTTAMSMEIYENYNRKLMQKVLELTKGWPPELNIVPIEDLVTKVWGYGLEIIKQPPAPVPLATD